MLILVWIATGLLFFVTSLFLIAYVSKNVSFLAPLQIISDGFQEALKSCGFHMRSKNSKLTQYKWIVTQDDEPICDDCLERTQWPAMDISEWMKADLPNARTPMRKCGGNCQCSLAPIQKNKSHYEN